MRADGTADVKLDLREIDPARFPNVFASLAEAGLNPRTEPVPVAPAAHYMMGGVAVDLHGRSSLPGLYAVGECLLHRPPRRQPARLQLAQRVLRLRQSHRRRGGRGGRRRRAPGAARVVLRAADAGDSRRRLAPRRPQAQPRRPRLADRQPLPAGGGDRPLRPRASRVARRPSAHRLPGDRSRAGRGPHRPLPRQRGPPRGVALSRVASESCCSGSTSAGPSPTRR